MAQTVNADDGSVSGSAGLKSSSDGTAILALQTKGTTAVTVDASQNVGVGTTSPGSKLDVKGTLRLSGSSSGYVGVAPAAAAGSTTYTLPSADGTNGQFLSTNGTGTLSWGSAGSFAAGTVMLFAQTSAPTGWTKDTTNYNNSALRVVTGSASTGGTVDFSTAFASQAVSGTVGSTTLTTSQIPSHSHTVYYGGSCGYGYPASSGAGALSSSSGATGGGGSHNHSFSGTAINLAVKYVDVIRATKD